MNETTPVGLRRVRSFVRHGRTTRAQQRALDSLWPRYGVENDADLTDLAAVCGREAPKHLEIGFGMGTTLAQMAQANPWFDYLGIEVHRPGVGNLLARLAEADLHNVRVLSTDAVSVLESRLTSACLDAVYIFFPDPWPKKRHHKRRLIQLPFAALLSRVLKPGAKLYVATDWENYAHHILSVLDATPTLTNSAGSGCFALRPTERPLTKFEQRGLKLGHGVWDLIYERNLSGSPRHPS